MNIRHNGLTLEYLEDPSAEVIIKEMRRFIETIQQDGNIIHEVRINGMDVTGREESYIHAHVGDITEIELLSMTTDKWIEHFTGETIDFLTRVHNATQSISNLFYGDPQPESWDLLAQLLEGLQFVMQSVEVIRSYVEQSAPDAPAINRIHTFDTNMTHQLAELEKAMQAEDYIQIADIIQYEIGDAISDLQAVLKSGDLI